MMPADTPPASSNEAALRSSPFTGVIRSAQVRRHESTRNGDIAGDARLTAPQSTAHFVLAGTTVTGAGATGTGQTDYFYGKDGVAYSVTIAKGANLFNTFANTASSDHNGLYGTAFLTPNGAPNAEVIYMTAGDFVNNGTLNTYPTHFGVAANNYHQTTAVVYINNTAATPSQVTNSGTIGDADYISDKTNPMFSYSQENTAGIVLNNGTITNNVGGDITGYNAIFTFGKGTINNYGLVYAVNDAGLTGFVVNNYANASMSTTNAGFACIHAYNTVNNWGYMLGADYCLLMTGDNLVVNDYGGAAVPGVKNFDGSQVYNGEISSLIRGSEKPNTNGPFANNDAMMLDSSGMTINLISQQINGTVYLPVIVGPMEGGFNGNFGSATSSVRNTLNFQFNGISPTQANGLQAAIAGSYKSGPHGNYYSGSYTMNGITYQWEDFTTVEFSGKAITGTLATTTAAATPTGVAQATATGNAAGTLTGGSTARHAGGASGASIIGPLIGVVLALIVLGLGSYYLLRRAAPAWLSLLRKRHVATPAAGGDWADAGTQTPAAATWNSWQPEEYGGWQPADNGERLGRPTQTDAWQTQQHWPDHEPDW